MEPNASATNKPLSESNNSHDYSFSRAQFPLISDLHESLQYRDEPEQYSLQHYLTYRLNYGDESEAVIGKLIYEQIEVPPNFTDKHYQVINDHYQEMYQRFKDCEDDNIVYQRVRFLNKIFPKQPISRSDSERAIGLSIATEILDKMQLLSSIIFNKDNNEVDPLSQQELIDFSNKITSTIKYLKSKPGETLAFGDISPYSIIVGYDYKPPYKRTIRIIDTFCDRYLSSLSSQKKEGNLKSARNAYCSEKIILSSSNGEGKYMPTFQDDLWSTKMTIFAMEYHKPLISEVNMDKLLETIRDVAKNPEIINDLIKKASNQESYMQLANSSIFKGKEENSLETLEISILMKQSNMKSQIIVKKEEEVQIQKRIEDVKQMVEMPQLLDPQWSIQTPKNEDQFFMEESISEAVEKANKREAAKIQELMFRVLASLLPLEMHYVKYEGEDQITGQYNIIVPKGQNKSKKFEKQNVIEGTAFLRHRDEKQLRKQQVIFVNQGLQPVNPPVNKPIILAKKPVVPAYKTLHFTSKAVNKLKQRHENIKHRVQQANIKDDIAKMFQQKKQYFQKKYRDNQLLNLMTYDKKAQDQLERLQIQIIPILSVRFSSLKQVILRNNQLGDSDIKLMIQQHFPILKSLQVLDLADNQIDESLKDLLQSTNYFYKPFNNLTKINLEGNRIKSVLCFMERFKMDQLKYVYLGRNQIQEKPSYNDCFWQITNNKSNNKSRVFLGGNPFIRSLLKKGVKQIEQDLDERLKCRVSFDTEEEIEVKTKIDSSERQLPTSSKRQESLNETIIGSKK